MRLLVGLMPCLLNRLTLVFSSIATKDYLYCKITKKLVVGKGIRSECHTDVEVETSGARVVEVVMTDIRQADVIAQAEVEHVEARTTSDAQAAVEAFEGCVVITEARVSLTGTVVLDLATDTEGEITTGKRLDGDIGRDGILIFEHERQFEIVEAISELVTLIRAFATFLRIREAGLEIERSSGGETCADDCSHIETRARVTAIEDCGIGMYRGYIQTEAEAIISVVTEIVVRRSMVIGVAITVTRRDRSALRIILCGSRQCSDER